MNKKYLVKRNIVMIIIAFVFVMSVGLFFNNVDATESNMIEPRGVESQEGIFDTKATEGIYKASEDKFNYLPYIRFVTDRIVIDKELTGLGTLFSLSNIEVNAPVSGLQVMFANDTVRVNSNMEYGVIFGANNVVIDGTIDKDMIVFGGNSVTISENAILNSNIICYTDTLNINGKVKGNVLGASNNVKVEGIVEKDLRVQTTNIDVKDENVIQGNIYVESYNDVNIKDMYPNAMVKKIEVEDNKFSYDVVMNSIITCLLFTLIYLVIDRKTKGKIYENLSTRVKENLLFVILSGSLMILALPAVILILAMLSAFGLHAVTLPLLLIYIGGLLVVGLLSTLIVGSLLANYMSKNYFKDKSKALNAIGAFFVFLSLNILTKLQYIGVYVTMTLVLLSVGIVMAYIFKKNNKIVSKVEEK